MIVAAGRVAPLSRFLQPEMARGKRIDANSRSYSPTVFWALAALRGLDFLTVEITNFRMRAAKAAIPPCSAPKMHICSGTGDGGSPDMAGQTDYQFPRQFLEGRLDR